MKIFETISCNICGSNDHTNIYSSKQYSNSSLGAMEISLVICNDCNFVFQNPQLTDEALNLHYTQSSSGETFTNKGSNTRTAILLQERITFVLNSLKDTAVTNICDVGGGKGLLIQEIPLDKNIKKYLVEPSDAIKQCQSDEVFKIKKFVEELEPEQYKFDFLMCISALEHFKDPLNILKKFYLLLSDTGSLYIEVPNSLKPYNTFAEFFSYEHLNHFTLQSITKILECAGFYIAKIEESESVPNIRLLAKKKDFQINKDLILQSFFNYQNNKFDLKKALESTIQDLQEKHQLHNLAIYGAGDHTKFILESFDVLDKTIVFIDSDPKKWALNYYDKKIIAPNEIKNHPIQNILISSYDFEKEIYTSLQAIISDDIDIIKLYNN